MNVQRILIQELMLYEFEFSGRNQKICHVKVAGAVNQRPVNKSFNKFRSGYKIVDDQARMGRPKLWFRQTPNKRGESSD